jgi:type IV pilus assembly protein PilV
MRTNAPKPQQGVMLIEALIGILIFSIGILAMLGMQAVAMQATIDAKYRSEASYLANQIIGTIWVDRGHIADYATTNPGTYDPRDAWKDEVARLLPGVDANAPTIEVDGSKVTVTVKWMRPGDSTASQHVAIAEINGTL